MKTFPRAYLIGSGIGSLAAAAFMIRDADFPGSHISIFETLPRMGGSLDASGDSQVGYSQRGGRMLTYDNYECTWGLFKSIPSLVRPGQSVYDETIAFNSKHLQHSRARLVDSRRAKVPVATMGFSMHNRVELLKMLTADELTMGSTAITDWLSPSFFETSFWYLWVTTFAFQPWHSAVEFRRYLHRFMREFSRIDTMAGVKRTILNQYDSQVRPLLAWLAARNVCMETNCRVTELEHTSEDGKLRITRMHVDRGGKTQTVDVNEGDLVFLQNGSMTDASSIGSMSFAPAKLTRCDSGGWALWESLAKGRPQFGRPAAFNSCIAQSVWESFTVTTKKPDFYDLMTAFSGNEPGTGGLVTFKDSNWLMSIVLYHQPYFADQPADVQVFWGYGLHPSRVGNFIAKAMEDCTGAEILAEICGHLAFDRSSVDSAICIPCRMPYITSMFMPRQPGDRPAPLPAGTRNLALISQFVEIPEDVVFTTEYSIRVAQMAVYQLLHIDREVPPITPNDRSLKVMVDDLVKAFE